MNRGTLKSAPNYTNAALVMAAVNLFWIFCVLWVLFGWFALLPTIFVLDRLITWWGRR